MFLNIDGFSPIHEIHQYFENRCIDTSNVDIQTILPIPNIFGMEARDMYYPTAHFYIHLICIFFILILK
jgi:hypothetical protein